MKKGFTLIELLVVVLIIGILSAIALPQYELAVMKSKMNGLLPVMRAIKDANEVYYLANGTYSDDLNNLDISAPLGTQSATGSVDYPNHTFIDNMYAHSYGGDIVGGIGSRSAPECYIHMFYDHSTRPGESACGGTHAKCAQICKNLGY